MNIPTITVDLDRQRQWKFSANATIAFYRALGKDAFKRLEIFQSLEGETPEELKDRSMQQLGDCLEVFIALLWAGLLGEDPKLSIESVGEMVGPGSMSDLLPSLLETLNQSMSGNPTTALASDGAALTAAG